MPILPLSELQPDMRLATAVVSPQGALLADAGAALSTRHIRLFKLWGVAEAEVEEGDAAAPAELLSAAAEDPLQHIQRLFAPHAGDRLMQRIARHARDILGANG